MLFRSPPRWQPYLLMEFVARWTRTQGYCPSVREIQDALHVSSTSVMTYRLRRLREMGAVDYEDVLTRTLRLTAAGELLVKRWWAEG